MQLMEQVGITSIRQLAKLADLPDHTRINAVIMRGATTSEENMEKVARVLRVDVEELYRITSGVAARPLTMPAGTEKLSERAKNAIAEVIRVMIEEKEQYDQKIVDKKSPGTAEQVQEKSEGRQMSAEETYALAARKDLFPGSGKKRANPAKKQG